MAHTITAIADTIDALQDAGREVWIRGYTEDGRYALVVDADNDSVSVAHVDSVNSLGRWECRKGHLDHYGEVFSARFPRVVDS